MIAIDTLVCASLASYPSWVAAPELIRSEFIREFALGQSTTIKEVATAWYYFHAGYKAGEA